MYKFLYSTYPLAIMFLLSCFSELSAGEHFPKPKHIEKLTTGILKLLCVVKIQLMQICHGLESLVFCVYLYTHSQT